MEGAPWRSDTLGGVAWLPRLIVKVRLKFRVGMPPELVCGCGGDRPFLRWRGTTLPAFLKLVWECSDSDEAALAVLNHSVKTPSGFCQPPTRILLLKPRCAKLPW